MMLARCNSHAVDGFIPTLLKTLDAKSFVRKMHGGAQSSLLRASDGNLYVVKLQGNPQGPNILANEALGSWLAGQLGLPVPECCQIRIDDNLINDNPEMWFETSLGRVKPPAGIHYASRMIEPEGEGSVYEVLPRSWFGRVENRDDFFGMLLLDLWSAHSDNRQACFIQKVGLRTLQAIFIDHGHMFGGPCASVAKGWNAHPAASIFLDRSMYAGVGSNAKTGEWLKRILSIRIESAYAFVATIPEEWCSTPMKEMVSLLFARRQALKQLIEQAMAYIETPFPVRKPVQRAYESAQALRIHSDPIRAYSRTGTGRRLAGSR